MFILQAVLTIIFYLSFQNVANETLIKMTNQRIKVSVVIVLFTQRELVAKLSYH